jgi:hypothetical protein
MKTCAIEFVYVPKRETANPSVIRGYVVVYPYLFVAILLSISDRFIYGGVVSTFDHEFCLTIRTGKNHNSPSNNVAEYYAFYCPNSLCRG